MSKENKKAGYMQHMQTQKSKMAQSGLPEEMKMAALDHPQSALHGQPAHLVGNRREVQLAQGTSTPPHAPASPAPRYRRKVAQPGDPSWSEKGGPPKGLKK